MPEGHTVQRTANEFNEHFQGKKIKVDSPQGRFASEAKLINNRVLVQARAIGKQLFLDFDNGLTCRIHLGIYGKWRFTSQKDKELPGQVRARFFTKEFLADLRGPTVCEVIDSKSVKLVEQRLGPDPTNPDPRKTELARFVDRVSNSKSPIGLLLMNQDVVSGIGNVYRAELLFRAGISPHIPGNELEVAAIKALWVDAVKLMKVGVATGFMITRDELAKKNPVKAERNYVYKREGEKCLRCGALVAIEMMNSRKLYWCPGCQN
ncbi:MAG: Fpg/Nei family DNA glycosylase [Actinobacteria bacterium]|uniref:DNA-(apurinic or apyrimidinic site) lyase n=1 Tax=freshwater metagenome TaxID=449393 RepID=A0A6J6MUT2_9ZZZZ|nr:Fpg/Nei family DNA glycosylase [Actinomycetota bacterium]